MSTEQKQCPECGQDLEPGKDAIPYEDAWKVITADLYAKDLEMGDTYE